VTVLNRYLTFSFLKIFNGTVYSRSAVKFNKRLYRQILNYISETDMNEPTCRWKYYVNFFYSYTEYFFYFPVQDNQQMLKGVVSFYYTHKITPTCFGRSLPSSRACGHTERTIIHIHPRRRQYWSRLLGTCNPLKMAVSCRNMSG
jgi:hypothetical protein